MPTTHRAILTATTYFRRRVTSGACGTATSNVVTLTVLPVLGAGTIAADQTVCTGLFPRATQRHGRGQRGRGQLRLPVGKLAG